MKKISDLSSLKEYFRENIKNPVFGVGVYAFNRLGLEDVISDYKLLVLRHSLETELMEKDIDIFSLEKGMGNQHIDEPKNSTTVLKLKKTKDYVDKFPGVPVMIPYKSSPKMEEVCRKNKWILAANSSTFGKDLFEDKVKFRRILEKLGINTIPGEICFFEKLNYDAFANKYGLPFVMQHPRRGGGKGTFFIHNNNDWDLAIKKIKNPDDSYLKNEDKENLSELELIITKFIVGASPSNTCCVTRQGILSTNLQYQILDMPELVNKNKGSGLFCGHDWSASDFNKDLEKQCNSISEKIGLYFRGKGYKGIYGLDYVLDEKNNKLYVVETNPRLLGSFPVVNMVHLLNDETPLMAFHLLEFLNADYDIDIDVINELIRGKKRGTQMILHNLKESDVQNHKEVKPGVYIINEGKLRYVRPGYNLRHIMNEKEFIITEGLPYLNTTIEKYRRLCRILTLDKVLHDYKELNSWAKEVALKVYKEFDLRNK